MGHFINRDWNRTEHDDFKLNVEPKLDERNEAVPIYHSVDGIIIGWNVQSRYE